MLAVAGALAIGLATLLPSSQQTKGSPWCIACGDTGGVDVLLNMLLFVPLGAGLALAGVQKRYALALMCSLTFAIESFQIAVIPGRDANIGDLLTNATGGALGFVLAPGALRWATPAPALAMRLATSWCALWLLLQLVSSYAMLPQPTDSTYFGQIGRDLGGHPPYPGVILHSTIDGDVIPNTRVRDAARAREQLAGADGALVAATIIPSARPSWRAAVVRIADSKRREILRVEQNGADLVFGIRTGAATLRLRPMLLRVRDVFPDDAAARAARDTVHFEGRYGHRVASLSVIAFGVAQQATTSLTPGHGWRLFFPAQTYSDGSFGEDVVSILWLFLIIAPAGYWAAFAARASARGPAIGAVALAGVLATGLVGVPLAVGSAPADVLMIAAAMTGVLSGSSAARHVLPDKPSA